MKEGNVHISQRQRFWVLMVLSVLLMLLPNSWTVGVGHFVSRFVGPVSRQGRDMSLSVTEKLNLSKPQMVPVKAYQYVYNQLMNQQQELEHLRKINEELSGVRQLLGLNRTKSLIAYIAGSDTSNFRQILKLDRGTRWNIKPGQIALGAVWGESESGIKASVGVAGNTGDAGNAGNVGRKYNADGRVLAQEAVENQHKETVNLYAMCMVGKVIDAGSYGSSLQLITDPAFNLPVIIRPRIDRKQGWSALGILQGQGTKPIEVKMVETRYSVKPGDVVFARSNGKLIPANILIGIVQTCKRDDKDPVLWKITVMPEVDIHLLRHVIVLTGIKQEQGV